MQPRLKKIIKKHTGLYTAARCIQSFKDPDFKKLVRGYYETDADTYSLVVHEPQYLQNNEKPVYLIDLGRGNICMMGFGGMLHYTLGAIGFANAMGLEHYILWGENTHYYQKELEQYTGNAFNYYFDPRQDESVLEKRPFVLARQTDVNIVHKSVNYAVNESDVEYYANLYREHVFLNDKTKQYLADELKKVLLQGNILGVHVRGTDFNAGFRGHPKAISPEEYLDIVKKEFGTAMYDKIFLATDDSTVTELFKKEFGNDLLFYEDVFRAADKTGTHFLKAERPLHSYKLGLETLRDIYTLACCRSLVCGMSKVSLTVRFINRALDKKFTKLTVVDHGINTTGKKMHAWNRIGP